MAWSGPSKEILVLERSVALFFKRSNKQDTFLEHPPPQMAEVPLPGGYDPFESGKLIDPTAKVAATGQWW